MHFVPCVVRQWAVRTGSGIVCQVHSEQQGAFLSQSATTLSDVCRVIPIMGLLSLSIHVDFGLVHSVGTCINVFLLSTIVLEQWIPVSTKGVLGFSNKN